MPISELQRDKNVTKETHRLFWRGFLDRPRYLFFTLLLHPPVFFFVNVFIPLQIAYGMQAIITGHFDQVAEHAWIIIITMFIAQIVFSFATLAIDRAGTYGGSYVQKSVFANYLDKDYEFYSSNYIGALGAQAARLRDSCEEYCRIFLFEIPKIVVIVGTGLIVIGINSLKLAILTGIFVLGTVIVTILMARYRLKYRRVLSKASNVLAGVLGDGLSHGATVKSFASEKYEQDRLKKPIKIWEKAQLITWDSSIPSTATRMMLLALTMAGLLFASSKLYQQGAISIAVVALVQLYVIRVVTTTLDIGDNIKKYESLMSASYEPVATMMVPTTVLDPESPVSIEITKTPIIEFDNISFQYPEAASKVKAVGDFSLKVKPGEKIGLVGYSGGGKTTVTKLLLRFMDVTSGSIKINDTDIKDVKQADLRTMISYVPQEPLLFHRSIKENISYSKPDAAKSDFDKAAKTAYIDEFVNTLPKGYDTLVGERGVKLSGGQRQRVAVARALLKDAPVLVLDEATSALDSQSEQYIQKALWELMKDRTAIVIAHRLSTIQRMDRIIVMDKGKIVQAGTHKELLKDKSGIYAALWSHQSGGYLLES